MADRLWFGLLHGSGFAGALAEIGLPPDGIAMPLLLSTLGSKQGNCHRGAAGGRLCSLRRSVGFGANPSVVRCEPRFQPAADLRYRHCHCLLVLRTKSGMVLGMKQTWMVACALGLLSLGCSSGTGGNGGGGTGGTPAVVCDDIDQGMRVLWGETHVHTRLSLDAFWFNSLAGTREAYQFPKGGTVGVACDDRSMACTTRKLDQALDFAAISDHAEFLGLFDEQCRRDDPAASCGLVEQFILNNIQDLLNGNNNGIVDLLLTLFPDLAPTADTWQQIIADAEAENGPASSPRSRRTNFHPAVQRVYGAPKCPVPRQ